MLFAADVLMRNPGALVIYDVKCSGKLSDYVLRNGGSPLMWKTGHSLMKAKMRETDAELAGEMSGHFFFKERWFGFDDGQCAFYKAREGMSKVDVIVTNHDMVLADLALGGGAVAGNPADRAGADDGVEGIVRQAVAVARFVEVHRIGHG